MRAPGLSVLLAARCERIALAAVTGRSTRLQQCDAPTPIGRLVVRRVICAALSRLSSFLRGYPARRSTRTMDQLLPGSVAVTLEHTGLGQRDGRSGHNRRSCSGRDGAPTAATETLSSIPASSSAPCPALRQLLRITRPADITVRDARAGLMVSILGHQRWWQQVR